MVYDGRKHFTGFEAVTVLKGEQAGGDRDVGAGVGDVGVDIKKD